MKNSASYNSNANSVIMKRDFSLCHVSPVLGGKLVFFTKTTEHPVSIILQNTKINPDELINIDRAHINV